MQNEINNMEKRARSRMGAAATSFGTEPKAAKRAALRETFLRLTPSELKELSTLYPDGADLSLEMLAGRFADNAEGPVGWATETAACRQVHMKVCRLLYPHFVTCIKLNGGEMTEEKAVIYDILRSGWDLREPSVRKLHKIKDLVYRNGATVDEDLLQAVKDLEAFYDRKKTAEKDESLDKE